MNIIRKQYIVNEKNQKVAVQIHLKTFEHIEEILENYALVQLMHETEGEPALALDEAKTYYRQLEKAP